MTVRRTRRTRIATALCATTLATAAMTLATTGTAHGFAYGPSTSTLGGGTLTVNGDDNTQVFYVTTNYDLGRVYVGSYGSTIAPAIGCENPVNYAADAPSPGGRDPRIVSCPLGSVQRVVLNGNGGPDTFCNIGAIVFKPTPSQFADVEECGGIRNGDSHSNSVPLVENGGSGDDRLVGAPYANPSNDVLDGGPGNDTIVAGSEDTVVPGAGDTWTGVANYSNASMYPNGVTVTLDGVANDPGGVNVKAQTIIGTAFDDTVTEVNAGVYTFAGMGGHDVYNGSATVNQNTTFLGFGDGDVLNGGGGTDTINEFFAGLFTQHGVKLDLAGADIVSPRSATATSTPDTLYGVSDETVGIEKAVGTAYDDTIAGSSADNTIDGGAGGCDVLVGLGGNDTYSAQSASASVFVTEDGVANDGPAGCTGKGRVDGFERMVGSNFGDLLVGTGPMSYAYGGVTYTTTGTTYIDGAAGVDWIGGGSNGEEIYGGLGEDLIHGFGGDDKIYAGSHGSGPDFSNNHLYGDDGQDTLTGDYGNDDLHGGADHDTLEGGYGNDHLYGDGGPDTLTDMGGSDDFHGGDDVDTIDASTDGRRVQDGIDTINGDAGNDIIKDSCAGGADVIHGGTGDDHIYSIWNWNTSCGVRQTIFGDDGNDQIEAQGQMTVHAGSGEDLLWVLDPLDPGQVSVSNDGATSARIIADGFVQIDATKDNSGMSFVGSAGNEAVVLGGGTSNVRPGNDTDTVVLNDSDGAFATLNLKDGAKDTVWKNGAVVLSAGGKGGHFSVITKDDTTKVKDVFKDGAPPA